MRMTKKFLIEPMQFGHKFNKTGKSQITLTDNLEQIQRNERVRRYPMAHCLAKVRDDAGQAKSGHSYSMIFLW